MFVEPDAYEIRASPSGAVVVTGSLRVTTTDGAAETPAWFTYLDAEIAAQAALPPARSAAS